MFVCVCFVIFLVNHSSPWGSSTGLGPAPSHRWLWRPVPLCTRFWRKTSWRYCRQLWQAVKNEISDIHYTTAFWYEHPEHIHSVYLRNTVKWPWKYYFTTNNDIFKFCQFIYYLCIYILVYILLYPILFIFLCDVILSFIPIFMFSVICSLHWKRMAI